MHMGVQMKYVSRADGRPAQQFIKQSAAIFEVLTVHCIIGAGNGGIRYVEKEIPPTWALL